MRTVTLAGAAALALVILTACGPDRSPAGAASPTPRSASPSPTPSPPPTGPTLPPAADGTNIHACYDGTCEVRVRAPLKIPMAPGTGIASLRIDSVTAQGVSFTGVTTSGTNLSLRVYAEGDGLAVATANELQVAALDVVDGEAVIHIAHS